MLIWSISSVASNVVICIAVGVYTLAVVHVEEEMVEIAMSKFENEQNEMNTNRALCMQVLSVQTKYDYGSNEVYHLISQFCCLIIHPQKYLLFLSLALRIKDDYL